MRRLRSSSPVCCIGRAGRLLGRLLCRRNTGLAAENRFDRCDHIAASVTGVAPCLSRPFVPSLRGSNGDPGSDFASLFCCKSRGDERSGAAGCLDDHDAKRKVRDEAIAARKVVSARLPGKWHFRYRDAFLQKLFKQRNMRSILPRTARIGRIANHSQARGIFGLVKREKFDTRHLRNLPFGFGLLARANAWRTL